MSTWLQTSNYVMAARLLRGCLCEDMDVILGTGIRPVDSKIAEAPRSVALAIVVSDVDRRKARVAVASRLFDSG